ncbi:polysaccharide pyruvyl transferase family protein [Algoriphagus boritolerans]|uniref:polysaccharide pyruvyl transferase family protein n=1 Tax=Algoriphagus boritolerans TaxID=308111 RepID=UPI000B1B00D6
MLFLLKKVAKSYISKDSLYLALQDFIQNEIILTEPYNAPLKRTTLTNHNFDTFIVGSDQVWRPSYSPNLLNYFLDFCKEEQVRKISYGASFGNGESEYTSKELIECKKLLSLFDGVSVREETGVKSCKDLFDINSTLVCDPTLLLSADDYKSKINKFHGNSICAFYLLSPNFEKISFILSYCKKNNLIPVSMTPLKHSNSETAKHIFFRLLI